MRFGLYIREVVKVLYLLQLADKIEVEKTFR